MFDLIGGRLPEDIKPSPVGISPPYIQNLETDIRAYIRYRAQAVSAVPADHWLVSLLNTLGQKVGYDLNRSVEEIYSRVHFLTHEIATTFGLTTMGTAGRIHIDDTGNPTIYLVGESYRRLSVTRLTPYYEIVPVRFISHDSTSLALTGEPIAEPLIGLGMDVIELDLGLLMLQYTLWIREQLASEEESKRTPQMFVAMHVLPQLKASQFSLALMNRCTAIAEGLPVLDASVRTSQTFIDRSITGHKVAEAFTEIILRKDVTFEYLLGTLPIPLSPSLATTLSIPECLPTRQVTWALILARYNALRYLFALCRVDPIRAKRYPVNDIRRAITRMQNDGGLRQSLPPALREEVELKLDDIITRSFA